MDVQYLYRLFGDSIENFVGVSDEGHDPNVRAFSDLPCALGPSRDSRDHDAQAPFKGRRDAWIICTQICSDVAKIGQCGICENNFTYGEICQSCPSLPHRLRTGLAVSHPGRGRFPRVLRLWRGIFLSGLRRSQERRQQVLPEPPPASSPPVSELPAICLSCRASYHIQTGAIRGRNPGPTRPIGTTHPGLFRRT
jgi:hypothetical protein